ncbi:O-antigen polymerase [Candidatus Koribacter versatilis Ellin345]|uniref:O-antigen polymerase n=1 Tax=Koribacter versatilis (strain Ellin345) TaxID=204669 RepID=Q1ING2_KORVE|nr:O-antigen ligase family protein [Candidatus Koribacter versatilis]ABF41588.1 O-antigen polymerase [Candidatus Koribacter versatilis Ellin345]
MNDLRRSALAIFFFGALLLSSGAFAPLWTDTAAHDVAEGGVALQIIWSAIYLFAAALLLPRYKQAAHILAANWLLFLLIALCAVSALWSPNVAVTLRKSVAITGTTLLGVCFALEFDMRSQLRILVAVISVAAVASLLAELFYPASFPATEFAGAAWHGVFSHKNLLGRTMSLGVVTFLCFGFKRLGSILTASIGVLACVSMIVAARSQTALVVALAIPLLIGISGILRADWRRAWAGSMLALTFFAPVAAYAISHRDSAVALLGRDATFTGRSQIWDLTAPAFTSHFWLGHGYGAFWWISSDSIQIISELGYDTPNAHNAFLDLGLQVGVIGIVLFFAGWLVSLFGAGRLVRKSSAVESRWPLLYLLFLLLYSFTESSLLAPNSLLWILYSAACFTVSNSNQAQHQAA